MSEIVTTPAAFLRAGERLMAEQQEKQDFERLKALAAVCRRCNHRIGEYASGGKVFRVGRVEIRQRVTLFCVCGGKNTFRPGMANETTSQDS